ncbi:MAG: hypothetical protein U1E62_22605 [Alsobacter sp.]
MTVPTHAQPSQQDLTFEADARAAQEIVRLIAGLEQAGPDRLRRIEPHVVWLIARNAGYRNLGAEFLQFVRRALAEGRALWKAEEKGKATQERSGRRLKPGTAVAGHA